MVVVVAVVKAVCIHFCHLRKLYVDPQLFLNGSPILVVEEVTFLGTVIDQNQFGKPFDKLLAQNIISL